MTTSHLRAAANVMIRAGLLDALERLERRRRGILRILVYHRIVPEDVRDACMDPSLISSTPEAFAAQMAYVAAACHPLSIEEVLEGLCGGRELPPRSVLVTFDDAYCDFLDCAWPILRNSRVPAVLFASTAYLSTGCAFWWDRLYGAFSATRRAEISLNSGCSRSLALPEERVQAFNAAKVHVKRLEHHAAMRWVDELCEQLGEPESRCRSQLVWAEVERLSTEGVYVAPHTRTHPVLSRISVEEARDEIIGSVLDLSERLGRTWPLFSYPCGGQRDVCGALVPVLQDAGIQAAVTTIEGHNRLGAADPLLLHRVGLAPHLSLAQFRLALTGCYDAYAAFRRMERSA